MLTGKLCRTYPEMKDSKTLWLGDIPNHWKTIRIGYVSEVIDPQPDHRAPTLSEGSGFPYVGIRDLNSDGTVNIETARKVEESAIIKQECNFTIEYGDIVFCKVGTLGFPRHIKPISRIALSATLVLIKSKLINNRFLCYALDSNATYGQITYLSTGSTRAALGIEQIRRFKISLPTISEQQAIADFLDRKTALIDSIIARKERLIQVLKEKRQAVITKTVTKGLDPNVEMDDSGVVWIGEKPKSWKTSCIKFSTEIIRGKFSFRPRNDPSLYDGVYPFIQTGDVSNVDKYITEYKQTLNEKGYNVSKKFPSGTLVMTIAANVGDIAILTFDACFPDSIVGFTPNSNTDVNYLYYLFIALRPELMSTAIINTQLNLNIERIGTLKSVFPPLLEQNKIADYLNKFDLSINRIVEFTGKQISKLKEYRQSLVFAAVTGKIKV